MSFQLRRRDETTRRAFLSVAITNVLTGFIGLATATLAGRLLGPSGRGELAAIQLIPNIIATVSSLGMDEAAVFFVAQQPGAAQAIVKASLRRAAAGGAMFLLAGVLIVPFLITDPGTSLSIQLCMPIVIAAPVFYVCHQPMRSIGYTGLWGLCRLFVPVSWLLILIWAATIDYGSERGIALIFVGAQVAVAALSLLFISRYQGHEPPQWPDLGRRLLRYGVPRTQVDLPSALMLRFDQVLMIGLVTRFELGLYVAAASFSLMALLPLQALAKITLPRVASAGEHWRRITRRLLFAAFVILVLVLAGLIPTTQWFFPLLLGDDFREATSVAQLLVIASAIRGFANVVQEINCGLGLPGRTALLEMLGTACNVLLLLVLIGPHGITGAAYASLGSYSLVVIGQLLILQNASRRGRLRSTDESDVTIENS